MEQKDLLKAVRRILSEEPLRHQFMLAPRETLITELGLARESCDALMALAPVLLSGGLFALGSGMLPNSDPSVPDGWGGWGTT
jgi:hypothetical protein